MFQCQVQQLSRSNTDIHIHCTSSAWNTWTWNDSSHSIPPKYLLDERSYPALPWKFFIPKLLNLSMETGIWKLSTRVWKLDPVTVQLMHCSQLTLQWGWPQQWKPLCVLTLHHLSQHRIAHVILGGKISGGKGAVWEGQESLNTTSEW